MFYLIFAILLYGALGGWYYLIDSAIKESKENKKIKIRNKIYLRILRSKIVNQIQLERLCSTEEEIDLLISDIDNKGGK